MEQEAQSHSNNFRQKGVEMIDRTYNEWLSIEILSEEFNPLFFVWLFNLWFFFTIRLWWKKLLLLRKQCYTSEELLKKISTK